MCNDVIRVEKSRKGVFCDEDTFFFPHRNELSSGDVEFTVNENVITFGYYQLVIPTDGDIRSFVVNKQGETVYKYKRLKNSGELPRPYRTPEIFAISDNPRVFVPVGGYSVNRQGEYRIEENVDDVYLLFVNNDARKLRSLYVQLTGRNQLVRRATLGSWNSKYYAYRQKEAEQVILDYEKRNVPLDNIVIDTDWRKSLNGWGYDINEQLFYDMKGFLSFAHQHGVEVMFNDHPEPLNGAHVFEPQEIAYREEKLQSMMDLGLDTWWYDRNWHTSLNSPDEDLSVFAWGMYAFQFIEDEYYQELSQEELQEYARRAIIMGNIDGCLHGNWKYASDISSHRYTIQWTGDIGVDDHALELEILSDISPEQARLLEGVMGKIDGQRLTPVCAVACHGVDDYSLWTADLPVAVVQEIARDGSKVHGRPEDLMAQMAPDTLRILFPYQEEGEISFSTIPERLDNLDAYTNWGGSERGSKEDILSELQKEMGLEQSEGVEQQMGGMQI